MIRFTRDRERTIRAWLFDRGEFRFIASRVQTIAQSFAFGMARAEFAAARNRHRGR